MKRMLATTALISLLAAPVLADESTTKTEAAAAASGTTASKMDYSKSAAPIVGGGEILASDFIDRPVYVGVIEDDAAVADASAEWENIGEISDVIMSKDGAIDAILVDVGGFLGMGEHTVAVGLDQLSIVQDADDPTEVFIVSDISHEQLEAMPEFDAGAHDQMRLSAAGDTDPKTDARVGSTAVGANDAAPKANADAKSPDAKAAAAPAENRAAADTRTWMEVDYTKLTTEDLEDATVYSSKDEAIGEIDKLILSKDGKISAALVDIGGFLGMGEKPVSLPFSKLKVMQTEDGGEVRVIVDQTRESLEAMPEYKS